LVDVLLHAFCHFASGEENPPTAPEALQADIGAETHDDPIGAPTRVGFPQPNDVIHLHLWEHGGTPGPTGEIIPSSRTAKARWYNRLMFFGLSAPTIISRLITLVIAFTGHEFAHAWAADELGDDTPRLSGRLTLNPLSHLDPLGSLLLVAVGFGWARPVPINPYALERRTPAGTMLVSAAGPLSNLLMAIVAAIPFRMGLLNPVASSGSFLPSASSFLSEFIFINLILMFFNLIPISPLDGEKVLEYFLPPDARATLYRLRPYGPLVLLALLFLGPMVGLDVLGTLIGWPTQQVFRLLVL
jgi:Zn-dependent protease